MASEDEVRARLRDDWPYYAEHCLQVVNEDGDLVPFTPRPAQLKLWAALKAQRDAGRPMRAIVLKSRKVGISTAVQGILIQNLMHRQNYRGLVVAQDNSTAGELFDIGRTMYVNLPDDGSGLKPPLVSERNSQGGVKMLHFGEPSRVARARGDVGINSLLNIDTAKEVEAGRGKTIRGLHGSEAAFWGDSRKAVGLFNAVPERPGTLVVIESTGNGHNWFKQRWDRAMRNEGGYVAVFIGWTEDENCVKHFSDPDEEARFIESIGTGPYGEDEPRLIEQYGCTPEQLNFRRDAIVDKCEGKLELWDQEYPSDAARAFVGSGKHVFSIVFIQRAIDLAEKWATMPADEGGPKAGIFKETATKRRPTRDGFMDVPTGALWVPKEATGFSLGHEFWTLWTPPQAKTEEKSAGQYIIACDPASGAENTTGDGAFHGVQVIDHRTKEQCAEYEGKRLDPDQIAREILLAALYYNEAFVVVENTGGYGLSILKWLWERASYRRVYTRRSPDSTRERIAERLGFDTNRRTKPLMEDGMTELLREGTHGIKSVRLALQLTTYVRYENGKTGPDDDAYSDLLMAYMIGQEIAREKRLRPDRSPGPVEMWTPTDPTTGY